MRSLIALMPRFQKPDERTLLRTLQKLSRIEHLDVRQQQLECVLQVVKENDST